MDRKADLLEECQWTKPSPYGLARSNDDAVKRNEMLGRGDHDERVRWRLVGSRHETVDHHADRPTMSAGQVRRRGHRCSANDALYVRPPRLPGNPDDGEGQERREHRHAGAETNRGRKVQLRRFRSHGHELSADRRKKLRPRPPRSR